MDAFPDEIQVFGVAGYAGALLHGCRRFRRKLARRPGPQPDDDDISGSLTGLVPAAVRARCQGQRDVPAANGFRSADFTPGGQNGGSLGNGMSPRFSKTASDGVGISTASSSAGSKTWKGTFHVAARARMAGSCSLSVQEARALIRDREIPCRARKPSAYCCSSPGSVPFCSLFQARRRMTE